MGRSRECLEDVMARLASLLDMLLTLGGPPFFCVRIGYPVQHRWPVGVLIYKPHFWIYDHSTIRPFSAPSTDFSTRRCLLVMMANPWPTPYNQHDHVRYPIRYFP